MEQHPISEITTMNDTLNRKRKLSTPIPTRTILDSPSVARDVKLYRKESELTSHSDACQIEQMFQTVGRPMEHGDIAPTPHVPVTAMPPTPMRGGTAFDSTPNDTTPTEVIDNNHATPSPINRAAPLNLRNFSSWQVTERYRLVRLLGKGSYGQVAEAFDSVSQKKVAIKKITNIFDQEIDAKRLYREIYILRHLNHAQVIQLLDVIAPENLNTFNELYLVFDFVDTDLHKLIMSPQYLTIRHIQVFLYQLLCGLHYIHSTNVIHRDLKPANILLNEDCTLMICDFGLSRVMDHDDKQECRSDPSMDAKSPVTDHSSSTLSPASSTGSTPDANRIFRRQLTKHVVTRWYRAPELILLQDYSFEVDMWSVGCIFAELLSMQVESCPRYQDRVPLFPGRSCFPLSADRPTTYSDKLDQLNVIFSVIGTPNEEDIGKLGEVKQYLRKLVKKEPRNLLEMYSGAPIEALDLLRKMLAFNPESRISVENALQHPFLQSVRRAQAETTGALSFDMDFESIPMTKEDIKARIHEEIRLYSKKNVTAEE